MDLNKNKSFYYTIIIINQDECRIDVALIADNVVLNKGVHIGRGCIIGPGVSLAAGTKIPENTRLMAHPPKRDNDFETDEEDGINLFKIFFCIGFNASFVWSR